MATNKRRKYFYDEHFLDNIDTQEKAYFLGFFYADGCNNQKQGKINFRLAAKDKDILIKFASLFFNNHKLYYVKQTHAFDLTPCSRYLSNKMAELGAPQRKTYELRFPTFLDKKMWPHFIRGYFDGDGGISKAGKPNETTGRITRQIQIAGNLKFLTDLNLVLSNEINTEFKIRKWTGIYNMHCGGNRKIEPFLDYIYKDSSIHLDRKYQRYLAVKKENKSTDDRKCYACFSKEKNKWMARDQVRNGKRKFLGYFNTKEEATKRAKEYIALL